VSGNGVDLSGAGNRAEPFATAEVTTQSACDAAARILARAGAQPRDAIDAAFVADVSLAACR
jgi:hypothetical protein